jgi:hypothetical protein
MDNYDVNCIFKNVEKILQNHFSTYFIVRYESFIIFSIVSSILRVIVF